MQIKNKIQGRGLEEKIRASINLDDIAGRLAKELDESVARNMADGILLSGGLDTSILAYLASKRAKLRAFTVALRGAPAPDIEYSTLVANYLKLKHSIHQFDRDELLEAVPVVVKVMDSFDPMEVRNSVSIYICLRHAKENGVTRVMTGDGGDELFIGYSFLHGLRGDELVSALQKLWGAMHFSSVCLAEFLGMEVKLPYLDQDFKKFAMSLDPNLKVRRENGRTWGKWILRKAFEKALPHEVVWRAKVPIEFGSGTNVLSDFFDHNIPDAEFKDKKNRYLKEDKVTVRNKEQLFYYEIYRSVVGVPRPEDFKGKICPFCNSNLPSTSTYCRRCGGYPV